MTDDLFESKYKKATLSRAIRHCSGVDSETRRQILASLSASSVGSNEICDVYVILPDVPQYFWKSAYHGICQMKSQLRIKHNIYTSLGDEDVVLFYLEEAVLMKARAVVLAAVITPKIRKKLKEMQETCGIFLLSEYGDLQDSFYFGGNAYEDGYRMGEHFCRCLRNRIPVILEEEGNHNTRLRIRGFCDALNKHEIRTVQKCSFSMETPVRGSLVSSKIASLLSDKLDFETSYCLYMPFGTMFVERILQKIKGVDRIVCLCHDCKIKDNEILEAGIAASINQDIFAQSEAAVRAAVRYVSTGTFPDQKNTYIPSELFSISEIKRVCR